MLLLTETEQGYDFVDKIAHQACKGNLNLQGSVGLSAVEAYLDSEAGKQFWKTLGDDFKEGVFQWLEEVRLRVN